MNKRVQSFVLNTVGAIPGVKKVSDKYLTRYICDRFSAKYMQKETVKRIEQGEEDKKTAVDAFLAKNPKSFRSERKMVERILAQSPVCKHKSEEEKQQMATEMLFYAVAYGYLPEEYLCFDFEGHSVNENKRFVSNWERCIAVYQMNNIFDMEIFNDKAKTYEKFKKYFKREAVSINKSSDKPKFMSFVKKHPVFVKKNVYESLGRSIELMDINACGCKKEELFEKLIKESPVILEEQVFQSSQMSVWNASSVNTVRCIAFRTSHGIITPFFFMKTGRSGAFVDNAGAGGIVIGVNAKTGVLCTNGYDELNNCYPEHPDSGIRFNGFQLPDWEGLIKLCNEISSQISTVQYIGWDLAHTDDGWVVIEGNCRSQMIIPQIVFKKGIKAELKQIMKDMVLIK